MSIGRCIGIRNITRPVLAIYLSCQLIWLHIRTKSILNDIAAYEMFKITLKSV